MAQAVPQSPRPADPASVRRRCRANELLAAKGLKKVADGAVLVTGMKGPLEEGWQNKVTAFADQITPARTQLG